MTQSKVIKTITLLAILILLQSTAIAQTKILDKKITVSYKNEKLLELIKDLDEKLGNVFSYQEDIIPENKRVSITSKNQPVEKILKEVLSETKITFTEYKGKIILGRINKLKKVTISGEIIDKETGESLIGANILVKESLTGVSSNQYGFYSITVEEGSYTLICSYMGYKSISLELENLNYSLKQNIELEPSSINLEEIVVSDKSYEENVKSIDMGVNKFTPKSIESMPVLFGEQDILKTIQLMPGVSSTGEGSSGFTVRGGSIDQNQILLDEANVYNASHLLGFFSVFNSDAIKNVKVIKGNFPAEYGGRLSSVMDIKMNEGNSKQLKFKGGIGLIASRLSVEGPIVKDKMSFIISGRRTYADIFLPLAGSDFKDSKLYFYDMNAKINYKISENDRVFFSTYFGRDVLSVSNRFGFDWGNFVATTRWNHIFGDKLFMNLTAIYSNYDYQFDIQSDETNIEVSSGIKDLSGKIDFQYYHNSGNLIKFGASVVKHKISPGEINPTGISSFNAKTIIENNSFESALYFGHEISFGPLFKADYGLRASMFNIVGPGATYSIGNIYELPQITRIDNGLIKSYYGLEPRIGLVYLLDETSSVKASFARNKQYLHLLSNSTSGTPTDIWQSSTKNVKPGNSDQFSIGYYKNFADNKYSFSFETYYKNLTNQIDYKNGADLMLNEFVESELVFGKGWAYGAEIMLKRNFGSLTGWIGYTWSKSERKFADINDGKVFPSSLDRTHDLSIVGMYKLNDTWQFSINWVYKTGNAVTFPSGKYSFDGNTINYYSNRNEYRMPNYHRMDIGATYTINDVSSINFSIYNLYGRRNAYSISFQENENNPNQTEAVRTALFSIFPSITYNFKF